MISLEHFGWNNFHQKNHTSSENSDLHVGRVIAVKGFKYYIITVKGELESELSGRILYGNENEELPKVGDWVQYLDYGDNGYIIARLPRHNELSRRAPGRRTEKQILATNIDYAWVVQGLDRDFNIRRIERYIVQLMNCDITPVIVLNKSDLVTDVQAYVDEVKRVTTNEVLVCSTLTQTGIEVLTSSLIAGKTYIMVGSSGVGKSSLLNVLMGDHVQKTNTISDFNERGRHTTTARELFITGSGALLIDTPGMREFGLTGDDDQQGDALFPAIEVLSSGCRFGDCTHMNEAGCAVLEALESGALDADIYESYVKLVKEQRRFTMSAEERKRQGKLSGRMSREANSYRKKYKN